MIHTVYVPAFHDVVPCTSPNHSNKPPALETRPTTNSPELRAGRQEFREAKISKAPVCLCRYISEKLHLLHLPSIRPPVCSGPASARGPPEEPLSSEENHLHLLEIWGHGYTTRRAKQILHLFIFKFYTRLSEIDGRMLIKSNFSVVAF